MLREFELEHEVEELDRVLDHSKGTHPSCR
jgi:hypothetical protein